MQPRILMLWFPTSKSFSCQVFVEDEWEWMKRKDAVFYSTSRGIRGEYFKCRYTCSIHSIFFNCFTSALTRTPHSLNTFCGITRLSLIEAHATLLKCLKTNYVHSWAINSFLQTCSCPLSIIRGRELHDRCKEVPIQIRHVLIVLLSLYVSVWSSAVRTHYQTETGPYGKLSFLLYTAHGKKLQWWACTFCEHF